MVSIPALFAAAIFAAADEHFATVTLFKTDVVCLKQRSALVTRSAFPWFESYQAASASL
jgi:hypothetical protein